MPFIGNQPTAIPLTSSDLTDGIVTNPKLSTGSQQNFRNIIINGDMSIAQRGTSSTGVTSGGYYTCDRWFIENTTMGTFTISQSTDVPSGQGFAKSLKFDCTTADASPASGDTIGLRQKFEGQNLQYLKFATSSAESLTLSFWIKSNKTGTYNVALFGQDSASTAQYFTKAYTISSADTWEKKTITYPGNTANGFDNDNARSLDLVFNFGTGSGNTGGTLQTVWSNYGTSADYYATQGVNIADNTSNELYITGVQLEAGEVASDFEFLPHDVNLQRCQRYFQKFNSTNCIDGAFYSSAVARFHVQLNPSMRASPSSSFDGSLTQAVEEVGFSFRTPTDFALNASSTNAMSFNANGMSGGTTSRYAMFRGQIMSLSLSSEL
jgi:hypothetical protein